MAKTKRAKQYQFTESKKQTKQGKQQQIKKIIGFANKFQNLFILETQNLTNETQASLRDNLKGEFYLGKKTLILKALDQL